MNNNPDVIKHRLEAFDIAPNKYRLEILAYLEGNKTHPTAAIIFSHLKKKFPYVSQATIYNTLHLFQQKGLILALQPDGKSVHYDATTTDHCHFVCEKCGNIIDIHEPVLLSGQPKRKIQNNLINRVVAYLFGTCSECLEGNNPSSRDK